MRRALALLISAAALMSPAGCVPYLTHPGVGGAWADNWSVPAPMARPDRCAGVDFEFTPIFPPLTFGLYHFEDITFPYVASDLGLIATVTFVAHPKWWPVFKPLIGRYHWSESPEETGLLTGLKVGAGVPLMEPFFLTVEYGWLKAHDAVGDHDARFQTAKVGVFLVFCCPGGYALDQVFPWIPSPRRHRF